MEDLSKDKNTVKVLSKDRGLMRPRVWILIVCGTLLNFILSTLVKQTTLPFYIDNVGSIIATAMGGIIPGVITALCTNFINFAADGESIFYASLSVLIAIVTGAFFESRKIKSFIGKMIYFSHYVWHRVFARMRWTRWFYMWVTKGKNRSYSRVELL